MNWTRLLLVTVVVTGIARVASAGELTQTIRFNPNRLALSEQDGFATVRYPGAPPIDRIGVPSLPEMPLHIVIPPTAQVTWVEVRNLVEEALPGEYDVLPGQIGRQWRPDDVEPPFVAPDANIYGSSAIFPESPVLLQVQGSKGGFRVAGLTAYPVRYVPSERRLYATRRMDVVVHYEEGVYPMPSRTPEQIRMMSSDLAGMVANPQDLSRFAPRVRRHGSFSAYLPEGYYEHVIVVPQAYADSFVRLRDWRSVQGLPSKIVFMEDICATYPGRDTAEQIRNFIKDAVETWGTIFVFLPRRDYPQPEYRAAYVSYSGSQILPCDLYFSDLDGSWDGNRNNTFGECPQDSITGYSDVYVGFISIDDATWQSDVHTFLEKLFRYECNPGEGYIRKVALPVGVTFSQEYADSIANATPEDWLDFKMYEPNGNKQQFLDSIAAGFGFTSGIHHGSPDALYHGSPELINSNDANALQNDKLGIFISVGCDPGQWDGGGTVNNDCLAENMSTKAPNGWAAIMFNARSGWVDVAEHYNYQFMYRVLPYGAATCSNFVYVGQALARAKDHWIPKWNLGGDTSRYRFEAYERNLFGEPAMRLWNNEPAQLTVSHSGVCPMGPNVPYTVTVTTLDATPIESALVVIQKDTECYVKGRTNARGEVTLNVSSFTIGTARLSVNAQNYYILQDSLLVISERYVTYIRSEVNDTAPGGNGDGIMNPGERVKLGTWVRNWGQQRASGVRAVLRSLDPAVVVIDSVRDFGDIGAGDSAYTGRDGFVIQVGDTCSDAHEVRFRLVCRDVVDSSWSSGFLLRVGKCVLGYVGKRVNDPRPGGNNNHRLDAGETAELYLILGNSGLGHAYDIQARLVSRDERFQVIDSVGVYPWVRADSTGENGGDPFIVRVDNTVAPETEFPCTLRLVGGHYESELPIVVMVGELRSVDPIHDNMTPPYYWAVDDADTWYSERPSYEWIECRGRGYRLGLGDDQTMLVSLPSEFGPVRFYDQRQTRLGVCSNGWVSVGITTVTSGSNTALPSNILPGVICANWDDLDPTRGGDIWVLHDPERHAYVIEWDSVAYKDTSLGADKFEIIIYDTTAAARSGNSVVVVQYQTANGYRSSTIGIQDVSKTYGICCAYDTVYHRGSVRIRPGGVIKYTTDVPLSGQGEGVDSKPVVGYWLVVGKSLFRDWGGVRFSLPVGGYVRLGVYDMSGRLVRGLVRAGELPASEYGVVWDGRDELGREVMSGVYFYRLETRCGTLGCKVVKL